MGRRLLLVLFQVLIVLLIVIGSISVCLLGISHFLLVINDFLLLVRLSTAVLPRCNITLYGHTAGVRPLVVADSYIKKRIEFSIV